MKTKQKNIAKLLATLFIATLVITSGIVFAFAQEATAEVIEDDVGAEAEIAIAPRYWQPVHFSGTGFIIDNNDAEPIRINARKNGRGYPMMEEVRGYASGDADILQEVAATLNIAQEELEESAVSEETEAGIEKLAIAKRPIKNKNIWSGTLHVGAGQFQEQFVLIGKENEDGTEIKFAVISMENYPLEISELVIDRDVFRSVEIWRGDLDLESTSYEGDWKLTASSQRYDPWYRMPLEIAAGEKAEAGEYEIEPVKVTRKKLFGFIPFGKKVALLKVFKAGKLVGEASVQEGQTAEIDDLALTVADIEGDDVNVVAETIAEE